MTKPKIHPDEVDHLIVIYNTVDDIQLKNDAFDKLLSIGLNKKEITNRFKNLKSEEDQLIAFEKAWEVQKEINQYDKYSNKEKLRIFLFGPFELFKMYNSGLIDLYKENFKIKFRQRLILLFAGTIFWILLGFAVYQYYDFKRLQEIEKTDISIWENNRLKNN